jgi:methionyl-tRNA formyltransferase
MSIRVAFFGSPEFAVPSLDAVAARLDVVLVVTQPDRPKGRGRQPVPTPVRAAAERRGLEVMLYERGRRADLEAGLRARGVDVLVVVAFGHILKPSTLAAVPHGAINVHASLLPRWRGAAPIERAILAGDAKTGVSLMVLDEGVDTGAVLGRTEVPIAADDNRVTLTNRLAQVGAALLGLHLADYVEGRAVAEPQPAIGITYAPRLERADAVLDFRADARALVDRVRGLYERPSAFTTVAGTVLKVHAARASALDAGPQPGTVVHADARSGVHVACGDGGIELVEVQLAGRNRAAARDLVAGRILRAGQILGAP